MPSYNVFGNKILSPLNIFHERKTLYLVRLILKNIFRSIISDSDKKIEEEILKIMRTECSLVEIEKRIKTILSKYFINEIVNIFKFPSLPH